MVVTPSGEIDANASSWSLVNLLRCVARTYVTLLPHTPSSRAAQT